MNLWHYIDGLSNAEIALHTLAAFGFGLSVGYLLVRFA